jgi:hypothetical protein
MKKQINRALQPVLAMGLATAVLLSVFQASPARADSGEDDSSLKGQTAFFNEIYWRWTYGDITIRPDQNGNAVLGGVVLMPLPNAPGDGTPASINVTLKAGQPFFLPLIALNGTSYTDGTPSDPYTDFSKLFSKNQKIKMKLDGKAVIDDDNEKDFFSQFVFDPPIPFLSPPVDAFIWSAGLGVLHPPLSPGKHTIKLDEKLEVPGSVFGVPFTVEYHNTFNLTVQKKQ